MLEPGKVQGVASTNNAARDCVPRVTGSHGRLFRVRVPSVVGRKDAAWDVGAGLVSELSSGLVTHTCCPHSPDGETPPIANKLDLGRWGGLAKAMAQGEEILGSQGLRGPEVLRPWGWRVGHTVFSDSPGARSVPV